MKVAHLDLSLSCEDTLYAMEQCQGSIMARTAGSFGRHEVDSLQDVHFCLVG
jgi:hypothetical protein